MCFIGIVDPGIMVTSTACHVGDCMFSTRFGIQFSKEQNVTPVPIRIDSVLWRSSVTGR